MYVIGTAGHVDHGKSTLVQALTGMDPDRLAEEKERQLTIDLGFAWLDLSDAEHDDPELEEVGVVDVPGHRDFIENMLAGVGGIDVALFVVAADEGVMPQTTEHLAILDLLEVRGGVVALTKTDLIDDPEWLELVELDLADTLTGTVLEDAPIVPVSGRDGTGIPELRSRLADELVAAVPRPDTGRPRLPVDRVFSLTGFGTVVTGTLVDGRFRVGDTVEIHPGTLKGRIRGLQTHKTKRDVARPGSRVAINLTGVDVGEVQRGNVVAAPGVVTDTILFDASYRHLPDADSPLEHNVEVKVFVGAAEIVARTRVIGGKQINPGERGWLQLALRAPAAVVRGDRFILRRPSPPATLGGGVVLDPHPGRKHRRFRPDVVERLETLAQGTPAELLLQKLRRNEPLPLDDLFRQSGLDDATAEAAWQTLLADNEVLLIGRQALSRTSWEIYHERLRQILADYHDAHPLRLGMPREEVRSRLRLPASVFNPLLDDAAVQGPVDTGTVVDTGTIVHLAGHEIRFTDQQQAKIDALMQQFARAGVNSPSVKESKAAVGEDVYEALVDLGRLRQLSEDVVYRTEEYEELVAEIVARLETSGRVDVGEVRDMFDTSRKYAIALLEHLDDVKVTRRVGDDRVLMNR